MASCICPTCSLGQSPCTQHELCDLLCVLSTCNDAVLAVTAERKLLKHTYLASINIVATFHSMVHKAFWIWILFESLLHAHELRIESTRFLDGGGPMA